MPLPSPTTLPLLDAAKLLRQQGHIADGSISVSQLLSFAAQGQLGVYALVGDELLKLPLTEPLALRLARGEFVPFERGVADDGNERRFRPKPHSVSLLELFVRSAELQALTGPPQSAPQCAPEAGPQPLDPADLPEELDIARIAFTAVKNGYGAANATFKNRLLAYLKERYPKMSGEACDRIATVANPDKAAGRRKG